MSSTQAQLNHYLALARAPGVGPQTFKKLMRQFDNLSDVFTLKVSNLSKLGLRRDTIRYLQSPDWKSVEKDLAWADNQNHHILTYYDPYYPTLLKEITAWPLVLFVKGDKTCLAGTQLAIVGSRHASHTGKETAYAFAKTLAEYGFIISSGLALGIDGASHEGALQTGRTIAVMATGMDQIYPKAHQSLAEKIANNGALVTEFPIGTPPSAHHFPRRNRIISGLSMGTLVIEASLQSGSLITAKHALEQNREVFAIPGSIHHPLSRGCHALIKQGAKLVESAQDIYEELAIMLEFAHTSPHIECEHTAKKPLDVIQQQCLECITYEVTPIDTIIARSGMSPQSVCSLLLELELNGFIHAQSGGYIKKVTP